MISPAEILDSHLRWKQLVQLGEFPARTATREAFQGCAAALSEISQELKLLGYPVDPMLMPCAPNVEKLVAAVENEIRVSIPAVLVEFWKEIGGVAFIELDEYTHVEFWEELGVESEFCDGLFIDACTPDWVEYVLDEHQEHLEEFSEDDEESFLFLLSPDGYHKDNISGGLPYGLRSGNDWLPIWQNFAWVGSPASVSEGLIDFVGYLRTAVRECACFPGLLGDRNFEPIRKKLLSNVKVF